MATPVVPSQFAVGKNRIVHKPTTATFNFDTGDTAFKSIDWGRAGEQSSSDPDYRKDDIMRVSLLPPVFTLRNFIIPSVSLSSRCRESAVCSSNLTGRTAAERHHVGGAGPVRHSGPVR